MAGETLIAACFGRGSTCKLCGASVNRRKGARLAHAATHLMRIRESGLVPAQRRAWPNWRPGR